MHPIAESKAKVVYKELIFVDQFLILFIREARKDHIRVRPYRRRNLCLYNFTTVRIRSK